MDKRVDQGNIDQISLRKETQNIYTSDVLDNLQRIRQMLRDIDSQCKTNLTGMKKHTITPHVLHAMAAVPRHEFVSKVLQPFAYENSALPIGVGQTISQPFMVAFMTDLLAPSRDDVILEIGTGSGYQAAILSLLARKVYSIEIIPKLAQQATKRLQDLALNNITVIQNDGYEGMEEKAPFDGIIVTAAAQYYPPSLIKQLKIGGKMIIPIGKPYATQDLCIVEKMGNDIKTQKVVSVSFVPMTGKHFAYKQRSTNVNSQSASAN